MGEGWPTEELAMPWLMLDARADSPPQCGETKGPLAPSPSGDEGPVVAIIFSVNLLGKVFK